MDPSFLIILLFGVGVLWFMSRRTRKQQQEAARFRDNLEAGQEVMTGSGLFGTVVEVEGDRVTLEIAPGVTSQWLKAAIAKVVEPPLEDEDEELEDGEEPEDEFEDEDVDGADETDDEEWEEIEAPDDASSLTPDKDDETPR